MDSKKESPTAEKLRDLNLQAEIISELLPEINGITCNKSKVVPKLNNLLSLSNLDIKSLIPLTISLKKFNFSIAQIFHNFFIEVNDKFGPDWELLLSMITAKDILLVDITFEYLVELCKQDRLQINDPILKLIDKFINDNSKLNTRESLLKFKKFINYYKPAEISFNSNPILYLFLKHQNLEIKILAAKLLDADNIPASTKIAEQLLGPKRCANMLPYITYTTASYTDLLYLMPEIDKPSLAYGAIKNAEKICDEDLLKELISSLGWDRINYGIKITKLREIVIGNSLPIFVSESEAQLLANSIEIKKLNSVFLIRAFGGTIIENNDYEQGESPVSIFRNYNLTHAQVLKDILDVAPLTKNKIERIISLLDKIVNDYVYLFSSFSDECKDLPIIYKKLKDTIYSKIENLGSQPQLSTELTRLVQMFEEPENVKSCTTLHGLKRYLHQKGLKLGFKLVDKSRTPNRTVDLVLVVNNKIKSIVKNIHYADFEPIESDKKEKQSVPFPIKVVTRGFLSQLLYGTDKFPNVNIFCYGNEIHYYVWFRNHPVFIRIDYSPPLQGGMIDLEYFGVSNYELGHHPNLELEAIRKLFEKLEFDVQMEGTRIHARYDKERTVDFGLLCIKAEYLFRMVPYMMDLDWIVGSLGYNNATKSKIIDAWADSFLLWGTLPVKLLLNKDQNKIICYGENESSNILTIWDGNGTYKDLFISKTNRIFIKNIKSIFTQLEIDLPKLVEQNKLRPFGQVYLEQRFLWPFREAIKSGEITQIENYFFNSPLELFQRTNPVVMFAHIISGNEGSIQKSALLAKHILPLERTLNFQTIGYISEFEIQTTKLPLLGNNLNLYVLRGKNGMLLLALYSNGNGIFKHRKYISDNWENNWSCDISLLANLLRKNNYVIPYSEPDNKEIESSILYIKEKAYSKNKFIRSSYLPGERIIYGLTASPGRATGKAKLGIQSRVPEDFNDSILVAESISPSDNTYLYNSSGIVSTGGGILSHAGLIAIQFNKPSLVINGEWATNSGGGKSVLYKQLEYKEESRKIDGIEITIRKDLHERQYYLNDGDIVILDADKGSLQVLGQSIDILSLYDGFASYGKMSQKLSGSNDDFDILNFRGKILKARHQIERTLHRLENPILSRYAIYEILMGELTSGKNADFYERTELLKIILTDKNNFELNREYLKFIIMEIYQNHLTLYKTTIKNLETSNFINEIVVSRLNIINIHNLLDKIIKFLSKINFEHLPISLKNLSELNKKSAKRLHHLFLVRKEAIKSLSQNTDSIIRGRHILRQLERLQKLIKVNEKEYEFILLIKDSIIQKECEQQNRLQHEYILTGNEGGLELLPLMGGKAANLAEINQMIGKEHISPWFAVTDKAFQDMLDYKLTSQKSFIKEIPTEARTIREAIEIILNRKEITNTQKSEYISKLWETVELPNSLAEEIRKNYDNVIRDSKLEEEKAFFAIRSSSLEEDAEIAARAGEFETFLFISGFSNIIKYLKKTWSGLWTERAIHNRKILGSNYQYKGGVIIQKIVWSRVSGVMQTINVSNGDIREIVINAGLGLGEGIVSGIATSDQITISKQNSLENSPLNFKYITADKQNQVVFDDKTGCGTKLASTLYHQRFRPALEYVELCELVKIASILEAEYGYPLDIEFAIEDSNIWIMQVRPVATFLSVFNETISKFPIIE